MITLRDTVKLAYTKLRTRRIRLFVVLFVSSLLFSGLIAGSIIVSGALSSLEKFSNQGFSDRYILAGTYMNFNGEGLAHDAAAIARAQQLENELEARKKAEAKRLGIEYSQQESDRAVHDAGDNKKMLNPQAPIAQKVLAEFEASHAHKVDLSRFKSQVGNVGTFYEGRRSAAMSGTDRPSLEVLIDGKEKQELNKDTSTFGPGTTRGLEGFGKDWNLLDEALLQPFVLSGQTLKVGSDGSIPVVTSYSAAQEALKLPALNAKATPQQKKQRLEEVRSKIAGVTFDVCYRNHSSVNAYTTALQQQADIKQNGSKKDYVKPELVYAPAAAPCADPVIQRDIRTTTVKQYDAKKEQFDYTFGKIKPAQQMMKMRIVGVSPDTAMPTGAISLTDIFSALVSSSIATNWASPINILESNAPAQDFFKLDSAAASFEPQQVFFAEYQNPKQAREVLLNKSCTMLYPGMPVDPGAQTVGCSRETRPFTLTTFGSASLAIDSFKEQFRKVQLVAAAIIGGIAAIILMGMIGRIIADARRETAIFRAIGASRLAISQIYIVYTIMLSLLITLIALGIGFIVALWVDNKLSPDASITSALMFNVSDLSQQFRFYGLEFYDMGLIAVMIFGASLIGSIIPIALNVRRNPIRDMREE